MAQQKMQILNDLREKLRAAIVGGFITAHDQSVIMAALQRLGDKATWDSLIQKGHLKALRNVPSYVRGLARKVYRLGVNKKDFNKTSVFRVDGCRVFFFRMGDTLVIVELGDHRRSLMMGEAPDYEIEEGVYYACDLE